MSVQDEYIYLLIAYTNNTEGLGLFPSKMYKLPSPELTPYELMVKRNVEENRRVLESLGLLDNHVSHNLLSLGDSLSESSNILKNAYCTI